MTTVHGAIEANLRQGSTKNILEHTKNTMAPLSGQPQFNSTKGKSLSLLTRVPIEMFG